MKLVIAEKPSVAQSLARVIGATKRQNGYLEGPCRSSGPASRADRSGAETGYVVSWCVGHLVELSAPERYDERFAKWRLEDLPILPERFLYEVSAGTSKTRTTYEAYRKAGYSKKFFEAHREELTLHKAAKQAFDELGVKKFPMKRHGRNSKREKKKRHIESTRVGYRGFARWYPTLY